MRVALLRAAVLITGCAAALARTLPAQQPDCATSGFRYTEWPERGPRAEKGRPLPPARGGDYGVDINSRIQIAADTGCLLAYLDQAAGSTDTAASNALRARIDALSTLVPAIPQAEAALKQTFEAYARRTADGLAAFRTQVSASARKIRSILVPLQAAIQARLEYGGMARAEADLQASQEMDPILTPAGPAAYDWDAARQLIDREIRLTRVDLDQLRGRTAYQLEIRAHLLSGKGQYPVALAGYNDESRCAETRVEPIELAIPAEQLALYQKAESLEHTIGAVRGTSNAILQSLSVEVAGLRPTLDSLWTRAGQAVAPATAAGKTLIRWTEGNALRNWVTSVADALSADPKGEVVQQTLVALTTELKEASADLQALQALAGLKDQLAGADARAAMQIILGRFAQLRQATQDGVAPFRALQPTAWARRADLIKQLVDQVGQLPPALRDRIRNDPNGPVRDIEALVAALRQVGNSLQGLSEEAVALVERLLGLPPVVLAANLPEPAGVRRLPVATVLGTNIELRRICADRHENDVVQVEYRFFAGERPIPGWTDRFRLRVFGWRSRVAAGLAFAIRQHTDTWRPGASVSWIFTHRNWPGETSRGLGSPSGWNQVGFGLTTVNLHFESDEAIELGIGPSISLLDDRLIVGAGWNLQAHGNHWYGLMSIRLLDIARGT